MENGNELIILIQRNIREFLRKKQSNARLNEGSYKLEGFSIEEDYFSKELGLLSAKSVHEYEIQGKDEKYNMINDGDLVEKTEYLAAKKIAHAPIFVSKGVIGEWQVGYLKPVVDIQIVDRKLDRSPRESPKINIPLIDEQSEQGSDSDFNFNDYSSEESSSLSGHSNEGLVEQMKEVLESSKNIQEYSESDPKSQDKNQEIEPNKNRSAKQRFEGESKSSIEINDNDLFKDLNQILSRESPQVNSVQNCSNSQENLTYSNKTQPEDRTNALLNKSKDLDSNSSDVDTNELIKELTTNYNLRLDSSNSRSPSPRPFKLRIPENFALHQKKITEENPEPVKAIERVEHREVKQIILRSHKEKRKEIKIDMRMKLNEKSKKVLPRIAMPKANFSYQKYGFVSDFKSYRLGSKTREVESQLGTSRSEKNYTKVQKLLPKFSPYRAKIIEKQYVEFFSPERNKLKSDNQIKSINSKIAHLLKLNLANIPASNK